MAATSLLSAVSRRLEGKVALITGAASGIGRSTAQVFAHHGAKLIISDIQDDLGHSLCQTLSQTSCKYVHCDVSDETQVKNVVDEAMATHGKLDIMFNNAGMVSKGLSQIAEDKKSDFDRVMSVNTTGVFLGIKHAARVMIPAGGGRIISTASIYSCIGGSPSHAYACSKHAVVGLTRSAAVELGKYGIRVNCISPYGVATPLFTNLLGMEEAKAEEVIHSASILKGSILKAEDIANGVLYLASEEGRYVNGHNLVVDGGYSIANSSLLEALSQL